MPGRRTKNVTNPQGHDAWNHRKREINAADTLHQQFQKMYRIECLRQREKEGCLSAKNIEECKRLGVTVG